VKDWALGKVLGSRYRVRYTQKHGVYLWSTKDAMRDFGILGAVRVAMLKIDAALNPGEGGVR